MGHKYICVLTGNKGDIIITVNGFHFVNCFLICKYVKVIFLMSRWPEKSFCTLWIQCNFLSSVSLAIEWELISRNLKFFPFLPLPFYSPFSFFLFPSPHHFLPSSLVFSSHLLALTLSSHFSSSFLQHSFSIWSVDGAVLQHI